MLGQIACSHLSLCEWLMESLGAGVGVLVGGLAEIGEGFSCQGHHSPAAHLDPGPQRMRTRIRKTTSGPRCTRMWMCGASRSV